MSDKEAPGKLNDPRVGGVAKPPEIRGPNTDGTPPEWRRQGGDRTNPSGGNQPQKPGAK